MHSWSLFGPFVDRENCFQILPLRVSIESKNIFVPTLDYYFFPVETTFKCKHETLTKLGFI